MDEVRNLLLDTLPADVRSELRSSLTAVPMPKGTPLYAAGKTPRYAHFMTSGIASVVVDTPDGGMAEVNVLGHESLVESLQLLGPTPMVTRAFIQVEGTALRMPFKHAQEMVGRSEALRNRISEFVQYQTAFTSQIAACNRLHGAEERLARWMLMVQDRLNLEVLPITQEFLASMLGARRSTVALVAGALQKAGMIQYRRGKVVISDREQLTSTACTCYPIVRGLLDKLYRRPEE